MRTVIFFGLLTIAVALKTEPMNDMVINFFACVAAAAMVMDVIDFIYGLKNKR